MIVSAKSKCNLTLCNILKRLSCIYMHMFLLKRCIMCLGQLSTRCQLLSLVALLAQLLMVIHLQKVYLKELLINVVPEYYYIQPLTIPPPIFCFLFICFCIFLLFFCCFLFSVKVSLSVQKSAIQVSCIIIIIIITIMPFPSDCIMNKTPQAVLLVIHEDSPC